MASFSRALTLGLMNPSYAKGLQNVGMLGGSFSSNRGAVQEQIAQQNAQQSMMAQAAQGSLEDPTKLTQGLLATAAQTGADPAQAMAALNIRMQQQQAEQARIAAQKQKEMIAKQLRDRGLNDLADRVLAGAADTEQALKVARDEEIAEAVRARGVGGRKAVASRMGIQATQFGELGLADMSDEQFENWRKGFSADTKAYQTPEGSIDIFRENEAGLVLDPETDQWVNPSDLGLSAAPQLQRVETLANTLGPELAKLNVEKYSELLDGAKTAQETLRNIATVFPMIDGAITGFAANQRLDLARVAALLGDDPSAVIDTESYISQAAPRVAEIIKAFGSGTGLSDKDREFAELAAAGKITMDAGSMKRVLRILDKAARGKLDNLENITNSMAKLLPDDQKGILDVYRSLSEKPRELDVSLPAPPSGFVINQ